MDLNKYTTALLTYSLVYILHMPPSTLSSHYELAIDPQESSNGAVRGKRQGATMNCDFGVDTNPTACDWVNRNGSILRWEIGAGSNSNWLGGPSKDATNGDAESIQGGYVFFETSLLAAQRADEPGLRDVQNAYFESPVISTTGAEGKCIAFSYQIDGLSSAGLRVMLQPVNRDGKPEGFPRILWTTKDRSSKLWKEAQTLYTYNKDHQIVFEGVAKDLSDPFRKFRGYVAIDSVVLKNGAECRGHCTFEGGFCGWTNEENDDFNWSLGRGSRNPSTGPATDRSSFMYGGMEGGYAYIDTAYPRRPGDVAKLSSLEFETTGRIPDSPMCLRFWTHMYGNGVGSLTVSISDTRESNERDIWQLIGEAGNSWYPAEVPVSSPNSFKIVITGKVGKNNLGDIAVDDISLTLGSCPTAPQMASPTSGDCTFEVDECGWSNVGSRERLDDIDWERSSGAVLRSTAQDHTMGTEKGYLMTLVRSTVQRPGSRAWFTSRDFRIVPPPAQPTSVPKCISFWFIMNEPYIDAGGPSLGALSIYTRSNERDASGNLMMKPIWRLYNHQGPDWQYAQAMIREPGDTVVFEGIWGSSRASGFIAFDDIAFFGGPCSILPKGATVRPGECRFERDMCEWTNVTDKSMAAWRLATISRRPANLPDKTFGAPDGYIYYDLFNQMLGANVVKLYSPRVPATENPQLCFSFWYVPFGAGEIAVMNISRTDSTATDGTSETLWSLAASNMDTARPQWSPAQVTVDSSKDFHIVLVGQATNGGFAVDDVTFTPGACPTRPEKAALSGTTGRQLTNR